MGRARQRRLAGETTDRPAPEYKVEEKVWLEKAVRAAIAAEMGAQQYPGSVAEFIEHTMMLALDSWRRHREAAAARRDSEERMVRTPEEMGMDQAALLGELALSGEKKATQVILDSGGRMRRVRSR